MEHDEISAEGLREAARAAINAGKPPMPGNSWDGEAQPILTRTPQLPICCAACGCYMREAGMPYKLAGFPGEPVMRHPQCVNAWHHAARDVLGEMFDGQSFYIACALVVSPVTTASSTLQRASRNRRE